MEIKAEELIKKEKAKFSTVQLLLLFERYIIRIFNSFLFIFSAGVNAQQVARLANGK